VIEHRTNLVDMYDIAIIGGGINGCGIARDAAGRGYKVYLAEKGDLAQGTSSGSTKLVHGGLRYLEHYELRLVREALKERETLWAMAPHIIWPMRFVLPYTRGLRPAWLLRLGLFLYDHIGGRVHLPATRTLDLRTDPAGEALKPGFLKAFEYSDCWVDDARLVTLNAVDAARLGAVIRTRTAYTRVHRENGHWIACLRDETTGAVTEIASRLIVNAAGPWVDKVLDEIAGRDDVHNIRLVQGSHIVVPKLFEHDRSYLFQNADGRIFFAIPYEQDFTLIGTTDRDYDGTLEDVRITPVETCYICEAASAYFKQPVRPEDVAWSFSAVRPLLDDGASKAQEATRDYVLRVEGNASEPRLVNIFGGKITTYRRLAESMLDLVDQALGRETKRWTASSHLPGGNFPMQDYETEVERLARAHSYLDDRTTRRLARNYGTLAHEILAGSDSLADLGEMFAAGLSEREVTYLIEREWARSSDDILWRRTKLGLRFDAEARRKLSDWLAAHSELPRAGTA
jgi:glycerol-3-phosphate dehydrogenase